MKKQTRQVRAGDLLIGGGAPVSIQTMWKKPLPAVAVSDVLLCLGELRAAGCDLVRFAVPDCDSADILGEIARNSPLVISADIHFDYRLALRCLEFPIPKIRINPGNIGEEWKVRDVVAKARDVGACLRIGVNAGSLPRNLRAESNQALALVRAAESEMEILDRLDFRSVVFSLKSSDWETTVAANVAFAERYDFPLHIGVTEAGPLIPGIVKNSLGITSLLDKGIGDTIRVSLSATALDEVRTGIEILNALHLRTNGVRMISCPQCGRATFDVQKFLEDASYLATQEIKRVTVAVMGCVVNGPGEARHADIGITGAGDHVMIFRLGEVIREVAAIDAVSAFREEFEKACARQP